MVLLMAYSQFAYAQCPETNPNCHTADNWIFGDSCGLRFKGDSIIPFVFPKIIQESSCSYSDANGEPILFTDGISVHNSNFEKINSQDLNGYYSALQAAQVSVIGDNYWITTTNQKKGFYINLFTKNNDTLKEVYLNKMLLNRASEGQHSIFAQNNRAILVTTQFPNSNKLYTFVLSSSENIICPFVQELPNYFIEDYISFKFSPSGNHLSICKYLDRSVDLYLRNLETGELSVIGIMLIDFVGTCEYSLNEQYIYVKARDKALQVKIGSTDTLNAAHNQVLIHKNNPITVGIVQRHGKRLFTAMFEKNYLGEIIDDGIKAKPNSLIENAVYLGPNRKSNYGLPTFNASYFYTPSIDFAYVEDCWNHTYQFEGRDTFDADGYKWIFKKGAYNDSILTKHCTYQFPDTGKWQVSHLAWNTTRADTVTKTLTLRPKWEKDMLGKDTFFCAGDSFTLRAPSNLHCVHWNGEEPNLDTALGPLVDYDHFHIDSFVVKTSGTTKVKLTNKTFCQMHDTIYVAEKPLPNQPTLTRNTDVLKSSVMAYQYRWFYADSIFTTSNPTFTPHKNGYWQVQLISEFGCKSEKSDSFLVDFLNSTFNIQHLKISKSTPIQATATSI